MEHNSQSIELMDALHTIGRNIAQQDAVQKRVADALDSIKVAVWTIGFSVAFWASMAIKEMQ